MNMTFLSRICLLSQKFLTGMIFCPVLRQNVTGGLEDRQIRGRHGVDEHEGGHPRYREADYSTTAQADHVPYDGRGTSTMPKGSSGSARETKTKSRPPFSPRPTRAPSRKRLHARCNTSPPTSPTRSRRRRWRRRACRWWWCRRQSTRSRPSNTQGTRAVASA